MTANPSILVRIPLEVKVEGVDPETKQVRVSIGQIHGPHKISMLRPGDVMYFTAEIDR